MFIHSSNTDTFCTSINMKDFYITLLSDSSMNMFPSNKQSEFTLKLDHPIKIDVESWEVALVEIATPSEVLNITEENSYFFLTFLDQSSLRRVGNQNITEICSSENGCYNFKLTSPTDESHEYLAEEMQNSIDNFEKGILKKIQCSHYYDI